MAELINVVRTDQFSAGSHNFSVGLDNRSPIHDVQHAGVENVHDGWRLPSVGGGCHAVTGEDLRDQRKVIPSVIDFAAR